MARPLHVHVFFAIARHITETRDLRSLALSSSVCLDPARYFLFHTLAFDVSEHSLTALRSFLAHDRNVAAGVRCLKLLGAGDTVLSYPSVCDVLDLLPNVRALKLDGFHWHGDPASLFLEDASDTLRSLTLRNIHDREGTQSPWELLRLSSNWSSVLVQDVLHHNVNLQLPGGRYHVAQMTIARRSYFPEFFPSSPVGLHSIVGLEHLRILNFHCSEVGEIEDLVHASAATLSYVALEPTADAPLRPLQNWEGFCGALRRCSCLTAATLTLSVGLWWEPAFVTDLTARGGHQDWLLLLLQYLPLSTQLVRLRIYLDDPNDAAEGKKMLKCVKWRAIGVRLRRLPHLQSFALTLDAGGRPLPLWRTRDKSHVVSAMPFLPYCKGSPSGGTFVLTKTVMSEEGPVAQWRDLDRCWQED